MQNGGGLILELIKLTADLMAVAELLWQEKLF